MSAQAIPQDRTLDQIDQAFRYHPPKGTQTNRYEVLRAKAREFALLIHSSCPESRERSTALTHLQDATMWANAAIACNE